MGIRVLLIEDNQADIMLVRQALRERGLGFSIDEARDADEASAYIEHLEEAHDIPCPDIVLLDLNVPKGEGLELLEALRRSTRCRQTPVIIMTSSDSPYDKAEAVAKGTTEYFKKPIELEEFLQLGALVQDVIQNHRGRT